MLKQWYLLVAAVICTACVSHSTPSNSNQANETQYYLGKPAHQQAQAIASGEITSAALVKGYLARIEQLDGKVNSVLSVNPNALEEANAIDKQLANGKTLGPLAGIPVLLKDNIESDELPTTAGSMALLNNNTGRNAPIVAKLKAAGAIVLGKTNLSEWANFRSESSISGWSAVGGLTRNPHMLSRSACGSSSGSGAAMSLRLASLAVGTETNGSIICPASINGVVGFKPTVGLLSRTHIVPISLSQDTAGPMTSSVQDAWLMASVMAGADKNDSATKNADDYLLEIPSSSLLATDLKGKRIGVVRYRQGDNPHVLAVYEKALKQLEASGATLVDISDFSQPDSFWADSYNVLLSEFHHSINEYLSNSPASLPAKNLSELIEFNQATPRELALFDQDIFEKSLASSAIDSDEYKHALRLIRDTAGENGIDALLSKHNVDVLVAPSNSPSFLIDGVYGDHSPVGFIGIGYLAAIAGYPHLTVPAGQVKDLPVGISFIGGKWQDKKVLEIGSIFEAKHGFFIKPGLLPTRFDNPRLKGIEAGLSDPR
ncbi:amidase [Alteromonas mediterranea]|jgi:amidase|uniref:Amidase n=1 Tax=Alteromonas mediterranea (strain DSM 17117 / CIP 110805 / LMG 28347 / Deep ecotype) TaxID=1774373 RepID=F2GBI9_ALTMD|nr:amidase [Alteromonas mediterranea]AGP95381.1 amidase [Alteromonas mediterranea U8]AEB00066.1 amidase [Alteromonas mediterranea DE]AGP87445.1 amidase [Alteromonas mediterranea U4]AGP91582.1 amidase [Alteromonas mediterranea U7]CAH1189067.1 Glutamyl-tRNA(Gln) amidotransferase subunit A [Alteromonas mediterranea]|tara:strand:- start:422 stop:2056 length:1635 start_codon:yes stop_codon:yes gene_type:complete